MRQSFITIKGASHNNLKSVNIDIPKENLIVITGISGSGKSSLAFDTIYAEGQRRYVESLSAYARQFLGRMKKPEVDYIEGLSPAISIDQRGLSHNPRSTVGTTTEIYDYLRLLFARIGHPHCPKCNKKINKQSIEEIVSRLCKLEKQQLTLLAPKIKRRKGEHKKLLENARIAGFSRIRINNKIQRLDDLEELTLDKQKWHYIDIVIDRITVDENIDKKRLWDSVETALHEGNGVLQILLENNEELTLSERFACIECEVNLLEIEPRTFSFNSPHGACEFCKGLGFSLEIDPEFIIPDKKLSINQGAIFPWSKSGKPSPWHHSVLYSLAERNHFSLDTPINKLAISHIKTILYGQTQPLSVKHNSKRGSVYTWQTLFEGIIPSLERRYKETSSEHVRKEIQRYMIKTPCRKCKGNRLMPEALSVIIQNQNIMDICQMSVNNSLEWVTLISYKDVLNKKEFQIAEQILKEIKNRLSFLSNIGLGYISLDRMSQTLSGGEAQRIRLATQIGSGLTGVLYVCDEPTIGLHPADNIKLINTLKNLRDIGNTVIVVEHDETVMKSADFIIDLGPGAGDDGGEIVAKGKLKDILSTQKSITGQYLSKQKNIGIPYSRRKPNDKNLFVKNASENNLQNINVKIPLGILVCITGVSGSGKSTLLYDIIYKKLAQKLNNSKEIPGKHSDIYGIDTVKHVINIDQSPIGRTPRSNPATYTGVFTPIRELFASLQTSKTRGYKPGRFSFNVRGGRCESCEGDGYIQIEMQFLPDVTVPCDSCLGNRYNSDALEIEFRNQNIAQILNMTVNTAFNHFKGFTKITSKLQTLKDVGLGYIKLGQPATTLSGGEAQRVKLSTYLSKNSKFANLYLLDEPTTGLSFDDCSKLIAILHRLVDQGHSVIVIEHHLDVIKNADWIIDMGPGPGDDGGKLVFEGNPEKIIKKRNSLTGKFLKSILKE